MNDREALEELLTRFGLSPYGGGSEVDAPEANEVVIAANHGGVGGYNGFHVRARFTDEGKFESLDIWE